MCVGVKLEKWYEREGGAKNRRREPTSFESFVANFCSFCLTLVSARVFL